MEYEKPTPDPPDASVQGLASEVPGPEAAQVQAAEIGHHTRADQGTQAQEALQHVALLPWRHVAHSRDQHPGHQQHRHQQFEQVARPARLGLEQVLLAQLVASVAVGEILVAEVVAPVSLLLRVLLPVVVPTSWARNGNTLLNGWQVIASRL